MFKTILVHVDDDPQLDARLQAAAWLANAHGAHLVGSASTGLSWPAYALLTGSMAVTPADEFDAMRERARASLRRFGERARRLGVASFEERLVEDESRAALLLQARYADLVVTGQDRPDGGAERALPQYLALHSARPVLVVPPAYAGQPLTGTVVAGWDGSVPALRALGAALPLLVQEHGTPGAGESRTRSRPARRGTGRRHGGLARAPRSQGGGGGGAHGGGAGPGAARHRRALQPAGERRLWP